MAAICRRLTASSLTAALFTALAFCSAAGAQRFDVVPARPVLVGEPVQIGLSGDAVLALPYHAPGGWSDKGPTPPELPALPAAFADIPVELGGTGWLPATQSNASLSKVGGTPQATARAQAEVFAQTQASLQRVLRPPPAD